MGHFCTFCQYRSQTEVGLKVLAVPTGIHVRAGAVVWHCYSSPKVNKYSQTSIMWAPLGLGQIAHFIEVPT